MSVLCQNIMKLNGRKVKGNRQVRETQNSLDAKLKGFTYLVSRLEVHSIFLLTITIIEDHSYGQRWQKQ